MSSVDKSKKKVSQTELRKFMQEHKAKLKPAQKKIVSPLAKYNEQGQLSCVLCKSIVKSENVWTVHINSKQHKDSVQLVNKLKERTNNFKTPLKRPLTPPHEVSTKKPKSILKNSTANVNTQISETKNIETVQGLPSDFFDKTNKKDVQNMNEQSAKGFEVQKDANELLPEGFFDDPKLDAKARNKEYKDPIQEEWDKFQKEIRDVEGESAAIIAGDQEESTTERQIDEIDEQMKNLSKVLDLEKKKKDSISVKQNSMEVDEDNDEDIDEDFDEFLDWRSKNSLK